MAGLRELVIDAVLDNVSGNREELIIAAHKVADCIIDEISENYRSLDEVHGIVDAVRAGQKVQVDYYDPDEDETSDYVVKQCW